MEKTYGLVEIHYPAGNLEKLEQVVAGLSDYHYEIICEIERSVSWLDDGNGHHVKWIHIVFLGKKNTSGVDDIGSVEIVQLKPKQPIGEGKPMEIKEPMIKVPERPVHIEVSATRKLNEQSVLAIKRDLRDGVLTRKEMAVKYNISVPTICQISTGKAWGHVKLPVEEVQEETEGDRNTAESN